MARLDATAGEPQGGGPGETFFRSMAETSYREDFCLRPSLQLQKKGHSGLVICVPAPVQLEARTAWAPGGEDEEDDDALNFSDPRMPFRGRRVPMQSTYNSFCVDRGTLVATPPPEKRNRRNRSEVPLGALQTSAIIQAPPILLPFDTKGVPSGRGGFSDEEIMQQSKALHMDPHPARKENTKELFKQGGRPSYKTVTRSTYTTYPHSRSVEARLGGRSYFPTGEKSWHSSKSDAAFQQGVHKWPRQPLYGPSNGSLSRCRTAPGSLKLAGTTYGEGPARSMGRPWRSLDGTMHED
mmetsp:Transcript_46117/g.107895  ORF Transcript_46117/g.107895 Transcript_46117/m.107895 type:complete len:296 (-) Transcript_46117:131-1018(-)